MSTASGRPTNWLDGIAIAASVACMIHCLALPVLIALLPAWTSWLDLPESFHFWFLLAALPFSLLILWRTARRGGRRRPLVLGSMGLALMAIGVVMLGHPAEPWIASTGAILLASAHVLNWRGRGHCHV
ncbi:MerC domain-containing protein [Alteraurantiacibacter aquimixticola]|uniref:MerC domain-containing protein n=1 Tax=Alteraurantiacibacter aquimixticola TaxID=2489173 RepID=A0A4V4U8W9_9SPHN|nr:MerC domain-containing protein [Alteraurantiacibacter aquimixticola]TIX51677.1 MerC domain-containing protein [Alteraurantiacibacter aquimixticola]